MISRLENQLVINNFFLFRFTESGIIQHWFRNIEYPKGKSSVLQFFDTTIERSNGQNALLLENMISGFYLLVVGLLISTVVFFIELYYKNLKILCNKLCMMYNMK